MSAFSELDRSARALVRMVRAKPVALLGAVLTVLSVVSCACLVGFLIVPFLSAIVLGAARSAAQPGGKDLEWAQLVLSPLVVLVPAGTAAGTAVGSGLVGTHGAVLGGMVGGAVGCVAVGAIVGVLAGAQFRVFDSLGVSEAIAFGLVDASRAGIGRRALAGATIALTTTLLPTLAVLLTRGSGDRAALASVGLFVCAQAMGLLWFLALGQPLERDAVAPGRARASLAPILRLASVVALVVASAVLAAALRPSYATSVPTAEELDAAHHVGDAVTLPGPHGLVISPTSRGVRIEAEDGGGAGEVRTDDLAWWRGRILGPTWLYAPTESGWIVFAADVGGTRAVRFDERGVRTDDGLLTRVGSRFGASGLGLLALALLLTVPFLVVLARGFGGAALLDRPSVDSAWTVWRGVLECDEGAKLSARAGRLEVEGVVRFVRDAADGIVTLGAGAPVLGEGRLEDGQRAAIVARSRSLVGLGPRTGATAWPDGAWLVVGSLDAARDRIVEEAARAAARFGLPAAIAAFAGCAISLL